MVFKVWLAVTLVFVIVLLVFRVYRADVIAKAMFALWYGMAIATLWVIWFLASQGQEGLALFAVVNVLIVCAFVVLGRIYRADLTSNILAALLVLLLDGVDLWCAWRIHDPMAAMDEALAILRLLLLIGSAALLVWRIAVLVCRRTPKNGETER
ncbi:MAG: hypothetical protein IJ092_08750 [Atopobiaceae bacterium]|nr:hypothetical protein [Atopobiaceae bacterium]MBR1828568.1 hypothetical protein [Atopobiaceae bacterium]